MRAIIPAWCIPSQKSIPALCNTWNTTANSSEADRISLWPQSYKHSCNSQMIWFVHSNEFESVLCLKGFVFDSHLLILINLSDYFSSVEDKRREKSLGSNVEFLWIILFYFICHTDLLNVFITGFLSFTKSIKNVIVEIKQNTVIK